MGAPSISTLRLRSGSDLDASSSLLCAIDHVTAIERRLKEDGTHELTLRLPAFIDVAHTELNPCLDHLTLRTVVWRLFEGEVTEWLVGRIDDAVEAAEVVVQCDPYHRVLADVGIIEHVSEAGARPAANTGGINLTLDSYLETFVVPYLESVGITWIVAGDTSDFDGRSFDFSFDGMTPLALIEGLTKAAGGVWQLRRDGAAYEIDILAAFGQDLATVWLKEGAGLLSLSRQRDRAPLRTVMRPFGELSDGEVQRATMGLAQHPTLAVATDTLTAGRTGFETDPTKGPIEEDGQFVGLFYESLEDGACWEIVSTTAPQTIELEAGGGASFAEGVFGRFVQDANGTLLNEVSSPAGLAAFHGRAQGKTDLPYAGHPNVVKNPGWRHWGDDAPPDVAGGFVNGSPSGTTSIPADGLELADGTDDFEVLAGDVLQYDDGAGSVFFDRITANVSVVSGAATFTIGTARTMTNNHPLAVHRFAGRAPLYFDRLPANTGHAIPHRTSRSAEDNFTATVNGTYTSFLVSGYWINLDGLTPGQVIEPGSLIVFEDQVGDPGRHVLSRSVADGSGEAKVAVWRANATADNENVTIRPPQTGGGGGYVVGQPTMLDTGQASILSQDLYLRYIPGFHADPDDGAGFNRYWIRCEIYARSAGTSSASTGWSANPPTLLLTTSGGSTIVSATAAAWSPTARGEERREILSVSHDITADLDCKVRFRWPFALTPHTSPYVWLLFIQVHLGMREDAAFVDGSAADNLFYGAQAALQIHRQEPVVIRGTSTVLADAFGIEPSSPTFQVGRMVRLRTKAPHYRSLDNTLLRVAGERTTTALPNVKELELGSAPKYFTDLAGINRIRPLFADVTVDVDAGGIARKTVLITDRPPSDQWTAPRARVPPGGIQTGEIAITPVTTR